MVWWAKERAPSTPNSVSGARRKEPSRKYFLYRVYPYAYFPRISPSLFLYELQWLMFYFPCGWFDTLRALLEPWTRGVTRACVKSVGTWVDGWVKYGMYYSCCCTWWMGGLLVSRWVGCWCPGPAGEVLVLRRTIRKEYSYFGYDSLQVTIKTNLLAELKCALPRVRIRIFGYRTYVLFVGWSKLLSHTPVRQSCPSGSSSGTTSSSRQSTSRLPGLPSFHNWANDRLAPDLDLQYKYCLLPPPKARRTATRTKK